MPEDYRLFVNEDRTVLVRMWNSGEVEVSTREDDRDVWGPPVTAKEEK